MSLERIALVSDVHGNLTAYEAVLADIAARGIHRIINLGDIMGKGPRGSACTALTRDRCEASVRGNWESFVTADDPRSRELWWRRELTQEDVRWLQGLPGSHDLVLSGRVVRLLHASPIDEFTRIHRDHTDEQFAMMFEPTPFTGEGPIADVVAYGDIHDPFLRSETAGTLVNVGSVGNQFDDPRPSYVILEGHEAGEASDPFGIQFVRVAYDVEAEVAATRAMGMPPEMADPYIIELRTGIYRGRHEALGLTA